jgi:2-polyprenyl-3-methyl-5-hydroxy-6-metoxy-1,4-benzoquinol methylase
MSESSIFDRAVNPQQYDLEDQEWRRTEGLAESARTFFFWEYLQKYVPAWKGKTVLDVGAGSGWLLDEARKAGAERIVGIEPSSQHVALAKQIHPDIPVVQTTLEAFDDNSQTYDVISAIMCLSHMRDVKLAFHKMKLLLKPNGELFLVVPDYDYFKLPRHDYKVEMDEIDDDQYVVAITRPSGTIADIVRKNQVYIAAGEKEHLQLIEQVPMLPTEAYIAKAPKFANVKNRALTQLLRFKAS